LVPKLVALHKLERYDSRYSALFYQIEQFLRANYVKFIELRPMILSATKVYFKKSSFWQYIIMIYGHIRKLYRDLLPKTGSYFYCSTSATFRGHLSNS